MCRLRLAGRRSQEKGEFLLAARFKMKGPAQTDNGVEHVAGGPGQGFGPRQGGGVQIMVAAAEPAGPARFMFHLSGPQEGVNQ